MGWAGRPRSARAYSDAGPNMSAVCSRYVGCVGRACCGCPPHCFGLRSRTANLASNLCHEPRLKPMRARFSTLKCSLTYPAPAYRSLPRMLPILRACDTLRSKMRGSCQKSGDYHQPCALWVALWKAAREWEMKNRRWAPCACCLEIAPCLLWDAMLMKTTRFLACWGVQIALPLGERRLFCFGKRGMWVSPLQ